MAGLEIGLDAPSREHAVRGASASYRSAIRLMARVSMCPCILEQPPLLTRPDAAMRDQAINALMA